MTNPIIRIHNMETDEIIEREMTADELEQHEADKSAKTAELEAKAAKEAEKAALLEKLGISESEAQLLLS